MVRSWIGRRHLKGKNRVETCVPAPRRSTRRRRVDLVGPWQRALPRPIPFLPVLCIGIMTKAINIISPHYDDAALSLALCIGHWIEAGAEIRVINCFTRTSHAPFSGEHGRIRIALRSMGLGRLRRFLLHRGLQSVAAAPKTDPEKVEKISALRSREDAAFSKFYGTALTSINLGRSDAPLRKQLSVSFVCRPLAFDAEDHAEVAALGEQLREIVATGLVLAPLALGDHLDHRIARQAAAAVVGADRLAFYEELPYAAGVAGDLLTAKLHELETLVGSGDPLARITPAAAGRVEEKGTVISAYRSQFSRRELGEIAKLGGGAERVWASGAWLAAYGKCGLGTLGGAAGAADPNGIGVPNAEY